MCRHTPIFINKLSRDNCDTFISKENCAPVFNLLGFSETLFDDKHCIVMLVNLKPISRFILEIKCILNYQFRITVSVMSFDMVP